MAKLTLLEGPAGSGKSQLASQMLADGEVQLLADLTMLWAAISGAQRDPETGRYPIRQDNDPTLPIAVYLRKAAVRVGLDNDLDVVVTSGTPDAVTEWAPIAASASAGFQLRTVDPGRDVVTARLSEPDGTLLEQCSKAIRRWYG